MCSLCYNSRALNYFVTSVRHLTFDRQLMTLLAAGNDEDMFTQGARIRSRLFYKAKVKSLRMTALIVLAFIVCWTPYQVRFLLRCSSFGVLTPV